MARPDVLVVDDEADIRDALRLALELDGYTVSVAANGRAAWELLSDEPAPSLVLLDLMMPVMNGADLLRRVRAEPRLHSLPVVLVTAFGSLASEVAAEAQGCLGKPVDLDALLAAVSRFCPRGDARSEPCGGPS